MKETISAFATRLYEGPISGPAEGSEGCAVPMKSEEACVGKRVKVRDDHRTKSLRGRRGMIVERWGSLSYAALDVLLDEGGWHLFWYHELEEIHEES